MKVVLKNLICLFNIVVQTLIRTRKESYLGDGVVTGNGTVNGRLVYVYAQDFYRRRRSSLSETMALKIYKVMDLAMKMGALLLESMIPVVLVFKKV